MKLYVNDVNYFRGYVKGAYEKPVEMKILSGCMFLVRQMIIKSFYGK